MSTAPQIYDLNIDEWRDVTQDDVDTLVRIKAAYGHLRLMSQDVIAKSNDLAIGKPEPQINQDIEAYMIGEDVRQNIEFEKRINQDIKRYNTGGATLDELFD